MMFQSVTIAAASFLIGCLAGWLVCLPFNKLIINTLFRAIVVSLISVTLFAICLFAVRLIAGYTDSDPDVLLWAYSGGVVVWFIFERIRPRSEPSVVTLEALREDLFNSDNDVVRDDAAELIAERHWQDNEAQRILVAGIKSDKLDDSLKLTCVESLTEIWMRRGSVNKVLYDEISESPFREVLDKLLRATGLSEQE